MTLDKKVPPSTWRNKLFIIVSILLGIFFGVSFGLSMFTPWFPINLGPEYRHPDTHYFHSVQWGVFWGIMITGSLLGLIKNTKEKLLLMQFLFIITLIYIVGTLSFGHGLLPTLMVSPLILAFITFPYIKNLTLFKTQELSNPLLFLSLVAFILLSASIWESFKLEYISSDEHKQFFHWIVSALLPIFLIIGGLLSATKQQGWRTLAIIIGVSYLYLGLSSIFLPESPSSWGITGGIFSLLGGILYLAVSFKKDTKKR